MKKTGFTLSELIAVIAILAVIMSAGVAIFYNVRQNVLENSYINLKTYLETAASEYALDTGVTTVTVETLIEEGYVEPDDETSIYDPRNNESINCYLINSTFLDGTYNSELGTNIGNDGVKCNTYEITTDYTICKMSDDGNTCTDIGEDDWFSDNIVLGLKTRNNTLLKQADGYTFEWSSTTGAHGNSDTITTNVSSVAQDTFRVIVTKELTRGEAISEIKIDKQRPDVISVNYDNEWSNQDKLVEISLTDYNGSGVNGVYVSRENVCNEGLTFDSENITNNNLYSITLDAGIHYACIVDKAGNLAAEAYEFNVENIDKTPPIITVLETELTFPINTGYELLDNIEYSDEGGSSIKSVEIYVDGTLVENVSEIEAGSYTVEYIVTDSAGNETRNTDVTLTVFVPEEEFNFSNGEEEYVIPVTGYYNINAWGAQGSGNGGKGAYLSTRVYLTKGDVLTINIGGQNGYNGGGVGGSNSYAGGGATTVRLNGSYLLRAAGGGGGSSGSAGGSGNGAGGSSVGAGSGVSGTNSGGGSSSPTYYYDCNCDTCGGGCRSYETYQSCDTCGGGCKSYYDIICISWGSGVNAPDCGGCTGATCCCLRYSDCNGNCPRCAEYYPTYSCNCTSYRRCSSYYPTYSCNCDLCSTTGRSGNGGSNYVASNVTTLTKTDGNNSGNGRLEIKYIN